MTAVPDTEFQYFRDQNSKRFNRLAVPYFASPSQGRPGRRFGRFDVADRTMREHPPERTLDLLIRYDQMSRVCNGMVDKIDRVANDAEKLRTKGRSASAAHERREVLAFSKTPKHFLVV